MANLTITKAYTPTIGSILNSTNYNTDLSALFNNFIGLEAQTTVLKGLNIIPSVNGTTSFKITNAAGTELLSADTTNSYLKLKATARFYLGNSYILESSANKIDIYTDTTSKITIYDYVYSPSNYVIFGSTSSTTMIDGSLGSVAMTFYINASSITSPIVNTESILNIGVNFIRNGIRIGTNSTNNMIDNASNGSSTTPLFIGNQNIVTSTGTTGGTASAGSGNQYVEFKIGSTTYKFLHDGTV